MPIVRDHANYREIAKKCLNGVGARASYAIRDVQPFQENGETVSYLWTLNSMCNIDKHRHLNIVGRYSNMDAHLEGEIEPGLLPDGSIGGLSLDQHLKDTGHEHKLVLDVDFEVCFMDESLKIGETVEPMTTNHPVTYPTVVSTLTGCLASANEIVGRIAAGG